MSFRPIVFGDEQAIEFIVNVELPPEQPKIQLIDASTGEPLSPIDSSIPNYKLFTVKVLPVYNIDGEYCGNQVIVSFLGIILRSLTNRFATSHILDINLGESVNVDVLYENYEKDIELTFKLTRISKHSPNNRDLEIEYLGVNNEN